MSESIVRHGDGMDWIEFGACLKEDPELFFPIGNTSADALARIERAKRICGTCGVRGACLEWALSNSKYGIWGGLTEEERAAL